MIELFKNHLFQLPCELFGGPTCFCGDKIFLSIRYLSSRWSWMWGAEGAGLDSLSNLVARCSFRLMGIIGEHSKPSAQAVYDEVDWITAQIGKGRFKAAEAITKMLLAWGDLSAQLASENELFLQSMYLPPTPPVHLSIATAFAHHSWGHQVGTYHQRRQEWQGQR